MQVPSDSSGNACAHSDSKRKFPATNLDRAAFAGLVYREARLFYNNELRAWGNKKPEDRSAVIPEWRAILWLDDIYGEEWNLAKATAKNGGRTPMVKHCPR